MPSPRIIDATLREGCQAPGARFDVARSATIARALAAVGVDAVECGHPAASRAELERVQHVARLGLPCPVLAHARACVDDVEAVAATGAEWVGIFIGVNEITRTARVSDWSREQVLGRIQQSVARARELGLRVRYTLEDASRTDEESALTAYRAALDAGADRICWADTVGVIEPDQVSAMVRRLRDAFPGVPLELHLHDDRGLATANALAGVRAGADWIACSVNGLGERAGITDLCVFLANLSYLELRPPPAAGALRDLARRVSALARSPVDHRRPVIGRDAFVHTARLHAEAMQRDPRAYTWVAPAALGITPPSSHALPASTDALFVSPRAISATELRHHREGPGVRYVMLDERAIPDCRQYCIVRSIPPSLEPPPHVDPHAHAVDSLFLFVGHQPDLGGLRVEVRLGDVTRHLDSPASVFIPSGVVHTYRVISGSGLFINHVLAGRYDESLLDP